MSEKMDEPELRTWPGYHGVHTRNEAPGAIPNGSRVVKVGWQKGDAHALCSNASVLGSMYAPGLGYGYFVEWDAHPRHAVFVAGVKLALAD